MTQLIKTTLGMTLVSLLLTTEARSEILRWPQLCLSGAITIKNNSSQNLRAWVQQFSEDQRFETEVIVPAFGQGDFSIATDNSQDRFALMHFADPRKINARFRCDNRPLSVAAQSLEGGVMTFVKSDLIENKIWLQNLFSDDNDVHIELLDSTHQVVWREDFTLRSFEQNNYKTPFATTAWRTLRVWADNRFTAFSLMGQGARGPQSVRPQTSQTEPQAAYFVIGPREGVGDSFIARISDPVMIARARDLIQHPESEKILFATIQKGHQGFNRNWSKNEKSFWSWSITKVTNFADFGSTACNGLPQQVEDDVDLWTQSPARICFWSYRIKKEVSLQEITQEAL